MLDEKLVVTVPNDGAYEIGPCGGGDVVSFVWIGPNDNQYFTIMMNDIFLYHGYMSHVDGIETTGKDDRVVPIAFRWE